MAHRKSNWYDEEDFDDGYSDDDNYDDYWGEEEDEFDSSDLSIVDDSLRHAQATKAAKESVVNGTNDRCIKHGEKIHPKLQNAMETSRVATDQLEKLTLSEPIVPFKLDPGLRSLCDKAAKDEENKLSLKAIHLVVLGHVDAGKSTLMGRMLFETGVVSEREVMKAKKEAHAIGKGSFAWAWMLDERPEERYRGVTVDVAMASFETPHKRVILLDAPGHRDFVPNMISGASQADAALIVVDGSEGGFESGMSVANPMNPLGGGQTREHVQLAKSLGINQIAIIVTKLDTCSSSASRFENIQREMGEFLRNCGFDEDDVQWTIAVGLTGGNLVRPPSDPNLSWYKGLTVIETIDNFEPIPRVVNAPLRMSISESTVKGAKNVVIGGKIHQGAMKVGTKVSIIPPGESGIVKGISIGKKGAAFARAGDTIDVTVAVSDPSTIRAGAVLCQSNYPIHVASKFRARIMVLDVVVPLLHGQNVTLHSHAARNTGTISKLVSIVDPKSGQVMKEKPRCLLKGQGAVIDITPNIPMPVESFDSCSALGRIALRDGGRTVAVGTILKVEDKD